jgi:hypothetical protein
MKHVVNLNKKQVEDLKWDFLQISFEFSIVMERDGSIVVRDEREVLTRRLKSMQGLKSLMDLVVPDAKPGDEVVLVLPDGTEKSFVLPS